MADTTPPVLQQFPLTPVGDSNTLAEREVAEGVFLIYDVSQPRRKLIGSVFTNSHGPGWEYWSQDSDYGSGHVSKRDATEAMQAAITLRANDVDAYSRGLRCRVNNPGGWVYMWGLGDARKIRVGDAEIIEFNKYGGTYKVDEPLSMGQP